MQAISPSQPQTSAAVTRRAPSRSASLSIPIWYRHSLLRILVEETCKFPLRIAAAIRSASLRWGYSIPLYPADQCKGNAALSHSFVSACSANIRQLREGSHRWMGALDSEVAAEAFQAGAAWAIDNIGSEKTSTQFPSSHFTNLFSRLAIELSRLSGAGPEPLQLDLASAGCSPSATPPRQENSGSSEPVQTSFANHPPTRV